MRALALFAGLCLAGCTPEQPSDGGVPPRDAQGADAGPTDGAPADAGLPDTGQTDTGLTDSGVPPRPPVQVPLEAQPPAQLSAFHFFEWADGRVDYNEGMLPYELNTALFSDYALKDRAIWLPPGTTMRYAALEAFELPVGSAIVKSFFLAPDLRTPQVGLRLVETRVLVRYPDGWRAFPYLWRSDGSDADYRPGGHVEAIDFIDPAGQPRTAQYLVPQRNQCNTCHELLGGGGREVAIIGPKARHLNLAHGGDNQLDRWRDLGVLTGLPATSTSVPQAFDFRRLEASGTTALDRRELERAARDYLDVNCAHCHNPNAVQGVSSQLFLNADSTDLFRLGFCKEPGSAGSGAGGRRFDIVPGDAEASILVYRLESETVGEMMPLLGRSLRHDLGAALIRAWVDQLPPQACQ